MAEQEPVDAATYAAHLERLDRIGREALGAEPAEAITLVREANDLVDQLLPMHRRLMDELAHHREALQAACDELTAEAGPDAAHDDAEQSTQSTQSAVAEQRLERLDGSGDDAPDVPF